MFSWLKKHFHISQVSVPSETIYPSHHRPLMLLLVFILVCQKVGVFHTFADSFALPISSLHLENTSLKNKTSSEIPQNIQIITMN